MFLSTSPRLLHYFSVFLVFFYISFGISQILKPETAIYNNWKKNPQLRTYKIVIYNWTNPEDINNHSIKPKFEEIGPYVFTENIEKTNIIWNDNDTITYREKRTWWFQPEKSNGSLDDIVTSVNPVAAQLADSVKNFGFFGKKSTGMMIVHFNVSMAITVPVEKFLFTGYDDPILDLTHMISRDEKIPDKFAYFYKANGSDELAGVFNIETGVNGPVGVLRSWNFQNNTSFDSESCGELDGSSAGDFFPGNLTKDSTIKVFAAGLCRKLEFEFEKVVYTKGTFGYKFVARDKFLDNGVIIPENRCFCNGHCIPYGVLDVSECKKGPAFVSLPHFYKADPSYLDAIEGMDTEKEQDDVYLILDQVTGKPLDYSLGLQVNLKIQPVSYINLFERLPEIYMPIFYVLEMKSN